MGSVFDPPLPDSCFETDAEFSCSRCGHYFVLGELRLGDADEEIESCRFCGAESSEVQRI